MEKQASGTKVRSFTDDYKRQLIDLVASSGRSASAIATEVGLHPTLLCRWVRESRAAGGKVAVIPPPASSRLKPLPIPTADQAAEIARLTRECDRLRMERDILKKSISIFAGPSR